MRRYRIGRLEIAAALCLAFFCYGLAFAFLVRPSIAAVVMIALFLIALHAMSPGRKTNARAAIAD